MRLSTTAARPASTRAITMLKSRKLTPNPPAPTSTAASQNRGAADTVPPPALQRTVVTSSDTSVATVNCQAVSERASDPSSKRLATTVYRLALSTPPATRRSPAAVPRPAPAPASTSSPPSATTTEMMAGRVMVSRSSMAASMTTRADSRPLITAPCTALVRDRPQVSPR